MHEKVEQKEELERQRVELMRRSEELDRREERIRMQEDERDEERKEEVSKRMVKAEECKYDEEEEYKRLVKSEKEWRQKVDDLRCQLEDVHYHSFLENVNRLIPKRRQVKCLIWYLIPPLFLFSFSLLPLLPLSIKLISFFSSLFPSQVCRRQRGSKSEDEVEQDQKRSQHGGTGGSH